MRYQESVIKPAHGGFGEWDIDRCQNYDYDLEAILTESRNGVGEIWELGVDELPKGMEDIRGSIHDEPTHVYGYFFKGNDYPSYFGIDEIDA